MYDLTIGIPTYNRADKLREALTAIKDEVKRYPNKNIEVLISDNCSSDSTKEVVNEFIDTINISYYRNDSNLGFDLNVDNVIRKSKSNYILTLSDDDILLHDSLKFYFEAIQEKVVMAIGKAKFMNFDLSKEVNNFSDEAFLKFSNDIKFFSNGTDLMGYTSKLFCGISAILFRRDKYIAEDLNEFYNSQFIHTAAMFKMLSHHDSKIAIIGHEVVMYRLGYENSVIKKQNDITKVGFGLLDLLNKIKNLYPLDVWYVLYNKELRWVRRLMIGIKSREKMENNILAEYIDLLDENRDKKYIDSLIMHVPDILFKIPYFLYRLFRYRKIGF